MSPIIIILAFVSALLPVIVWFIILKRKNRTGFWQRFVITFLFAGLGGMAAVQFQPALENSLAAIGVSVLGIYFLLGVVVEYFKNFIVRFCGFHYFKTIDDVLDLSFAAALGFTFSENFFHFLTAFSGNNPEVVGPIKMVKYFLQREFFILPIHLFTSGIFGYFYGLALFSGAELQQRKSRTGFFRIVRVLFFFIPPSISFKVVSIAQGTIMSILFYALFFTMLKIDPSLSDLFHFFGVAEMPIDEKLSPIISFFFFKFGSIVLFSLMDKKRRYNRQKLFIT